MQNNNTFIDNSNTSNQHNPMTQRALIIALIAIPCLMIVFGLLVDTLPGPDASSSANLSMLGYLSIPVVIYAISYSLLRNNPRLRQASRWTFQSYAQSVLGLDEREKQVIDQAFRTSYRVIALTCTLVLACVFINIYWWHLSYHLGQIGILYIMLGAVALLVYLPTAIVSWKEDI